MNDCNCKVSLCAGANLYLPWAALLVGAGAGFVYAGVHSLMIRLANMGSIYENKLRYQMILQVDKKCWFSGVVSTTPWMQWLYMLEEVSIDMIYKIISHPCLPILTLNIGVWCSAKMEMIMATPGLWGLLCVPFFMSVNLPVGERGILFDGGIS